MKREFNRDRIKKFLDAVKIKTGMADVCRYWGNCSALKGLSDREVSENLQQLCLGNYQNCLKYEDLEAGR